MWVYLIAAFLFLIGIVGALFGGGIFTIVLIPIALIVAGAGMVFGGGGRAAQGRAGRGTQASHTSDQPLPHKPPRPTGRAPSSPERLADARRAQQ